VYKPASLTAVAVTSSAASSATPPSNLSNATHSNDVLKLGQWSEIDAKLVHKEFDQLLLRTYRNFCVEEHKVAKP